MDHVVYLDARAKEIDEKLFGGKTMIICGAAGWKLPEGRVHAGDMLYYINIICGENDRLFPGHPGGCR